MCRHRSHLSHSFCLLAYKTFFCDNFRRNWNPKWAEVILSLSLCLWSWNRGKDFNATARANKQQPRVHSLLDTNWSRSDSVKHMMSMPFSTRCRICAADGDGNKFEKEKHPCRVIRLSKKNVVTLFDICVNLSINSLFRFSFRRLITALTMVYIRWNTDENKTWKKRHSRWPFSYNFNTLSRNESAWIVECTRFFLSFSLKLGLKSPCAIYFSAKWFFHLFRSQESVWWNCQAPMRNR